MMIEVLKSKIHRVRVTQANLNYVGSITIDEDLMDAANMIEGEKVQVLDINNGERLETYIINQFGKALALQALPMTQGVYGLVAAFLMLAMLGLFGNPEHLTTLPIAAGAYYLMASLPIALSGYFSAVRQGRVSAAGINLLSKRPAESGKAITSSALVETYAIFALLITLLLVFFSPFNA